MTGSVALLIVLLKACLASHAVKNDLDMTGKEECSADRVR